MTFLLRSPFCLRLYNSGIRLFLLLLLFPLIVQAQFTEFGRADSLRGSLNVYRSCFDVQHYDLEVKIDLDRHRIAGSNAIRFRVLKPFRVLQLDLFEQYKIAKIIHKGRKLSFKREYQAIFVEFPQLMQPGSIEEITVFYGGTPVEASNPPWDGGFIWEQDANGKPLISVACEGLGASAWWPLKDHLSDEPDSMSMSFIIPKGIKLVSNGSFRSETQLPGNFTRHEWAVTYPINSYNVTFYIGDYVHFREYFQNTSGLHPMDFYVLKGNEQIARPHFRQIKDMMECFEGFFGEYPFWRDGYALVETSYWGMEHQSAIAYGNKYQNNEFGFDFIIIHESAHEWFGNSLSVPDHGEMWVHEAFATYAEALYMEYLNGYDNSLQYLQSQRLMIQNKVPIMGPLGVNFDDWPDSDMYMKGSWMLHTLRNAVADDEKWFRAIRGFTTEYRHQVLTTEEVIRFFNRALGADYSWLFIEYLYSPNMPRLEYKIEGKKKKSSLSYRWRAHTADFQLPLSVTLGSQKVRIYPTTEWQSIEQKNLSENAFRIDMSTGLFEAMRIRD